MTIYYIIPCIFGYKDIYKNWIYSISNKYIGNVFIEDYPFDNIINNEKNLINVIVQRICKICVERNETNIIIIGHSFGCHIICSMYNYLFHQLNRINVKIEKCYLLFPYIDKTNDIYTKTGLCLLYNFYKYFPNLFVMIIYYIVWILSIFMKIFSNVEINHIKSILNMIYKIHLSKFDNNYHIINCYQNVFEIIYCDDIYFPKELVDKCLVKKHFIDTYHCFMFDSNSFKYINQIIFKKIN